MTPHRAPHIDLSRPGKRAKGRSNAGGGGSKNICPYPWDSSSNNMTHLLGHKKQAIKANYQVSRGSYLLAAGIQRLLEIRGFWAANFESFRCDFWFSFSRTSSYFHTRTHARGNDFITHTARRLFFGVFKSFPKFPSNRWVDERRRRMCGKLFFPCFPRLDSLGFSIFAIFVTMRPLFRLLFRLFFCQMMRCLAYQQFRLPFDFRLHFGLQF